MKSILYLATLMLASSFAHGDELESFDLLNNRLTISVPKGAKNEARGHNIMAAPESNESETRLVFEDGEKKLVVMAWELFQRSGANYPEEAHKALKEWSESESTPFKISTVQNHITLGIPEMPNTEDDAILYAAAFVRHTNSTVQRVAVYFNPEFHKTPERCSEWAWKIIESIKAGSRSLDLKACERRLGVLNEGYQMTLAVPEGWTYTTQRGPDFLVHSLQEVSDLALHRKTSVSMWADTPAFTTRTLTRQSHQGCPESAAVRPGAGVDRVFGQNFQRLEVGGYHQRHSPGR